MNAVDFLKGNPDRRLYEVTVALGGELLAAGGLAADDADGRRKIAAAFASGRAAEIFGRMVAALGGPADFMEKPEKHLKAAPRRPSGHGGARRHGHEASTPAPSASPWWRSAAAACKPEDSIDHSVGFTRLAGLGAKVGPDAPLALVHARDEAAAVEAEAALKQAYVLGQAAPAAGQTVYRRIGS